MSGLMWSHYEVREEEAKIGGFFGLAFDTTSMYKYLFLGLIVGGGAMISAVALGDSATKLLGFFDNYNPSQEGYNYDGSERDSDGTSITYDLSFHFVTYIMELVVVSAIWLGAIIFGAVYMDASSKLGPECDLDNIDKARYSYWATYNWAGLKTVDQCKSELTRWFNDLDVDNNGSVSKCEDAKFLMAIGNTKEYTIKYAANVADKATAVGNCAGLVGAN